MDALIVKLPAELEISEVTQYHSELLQLLADNDAPRNIQIDASDLWRIDTAGIQLLVALVDEVSTQNRSLSWQSISDEFKQCAERLNLTDILLTANTSS